MSALGAWQVDTLELKFVRFQPRAGVKKRVRGQLGAEIHFVIIFIIIRRFIFYVYIIFVACLIPAGTISFGPALFAIFDESI